jgi:hypothetical protein
MQRFEELNQFNETFQLPYIDNRLATVEFTEQDSEDTIIVASTSQVITPDINIADIINPVVTDITYSVEIISPSGLTGSTIIWNTLPNGPILGGVTASQIGSKYILSNIENKLQWDQIRTFTWTLPANYDSFLTWYLKVTLEYYDENLGAFTSRIVDIYDIDHYTVAQMTATTAITKAICTSVINILPATWNLTTKLVTGRGLADIEINTSLVANLSIFKQIQLRSNFGLSVNVNNFLKSFVSNFEVISKGDVTGSDYKLVSFATAYRARDPSPIRNFLLTADDSDVLGPYTNYKLTISNIGDHQPGAPVVVQSAKTVTNKSYYISDELIKYYDKQGITAVSNNLYEYNSSNEYVFKLTTVSDYRWKQCRFMPTRVIATSVSRRVYDEISNLYTRIDANLSAGITMNATRILGDTYEEVIARVTELYGYNYYIDVTDNSLYVRPDQVGIYDALTRQFQWTIKYDEFIPNKLDSVEIKCLDTDWIRKYNEFDNLEQVLLDYGIVQPTNSQLDDIYTLTDSVTFGIIDAFPDVEPDKLIVEKDNDQWLYYGTFAELTDILSSNYLITDPFIFNWYENVYALLFNEIQFTTEVLDNFDITITSGDGELMIDNIPQNPGSNVYIERNIGLDRIRELISPNTPGQTVYYYPTYNYQPASNPVTVDISIDNELILSRTTFMGWDTYYGDYTEWKWNTNFQMETIGERVIGNVLWVNANVLASGLRIFDLRINQINSTITMPNTLLGKVRRTGSHRNITASVSCIGNRVYITNNTLDRFYQANTNNNLIFATNPVQFNDAVENTSYTLTATATNGRFSDSTSQLPSTIGPNYTYTFNASTLTEINAKIAQLVFWPDKGFSGLADYTLKLYSPSSTGTVIWTVTNLIQFNGFQNFTPTYNQTSLPTLTAFEVYYVTWDILCIGGGGGGGYTGSAGGAGGVTELYEYDLRNLIIPGATPTIASVTRIVGNGGTGGTSFGQAADETSNNPDGYQGGSSYIRNNTTSTMIAIATGGAPAYRTGLRRGGSSGEPQSYTGSDSTVYSNGAGGFINTPGSGAGAGGPSILSSLVQSSSSPIGTPLNYGPPFYSNFRLAMGLDPLVGYGGRGELGYWQTGNKTATQQTAVGSGGNGIDDLYHTQGNSGIGGYVAIRRYLISNIESYNLSAWSTATLVCDAREQPRIQLDASLNVNSTMSGAGSFVVLIQYSAALSSNVSVSCDARLQPRIQLNAAVSSNLTLSASNSTISISNLDTSRGYTSNAANNIFASNRPTITKTGATTGITTFAADVSITNGKIGTSTNIATSTYTFSASTLSALNTALGTAVFYPTRNTAAACAITIVYKELIGGVWYKIGQQSSTGTPITKTATGAAITARTITLGATGTVAISQLEREYALFDMHLMGAGGGGSARSTPSSKPGNGGGAGGYHKYIAMPGTGSSSNSTSAFWDVVIGNNGVGGTGTVAATAGTQSSIIFNGNTLIAPGGSAGAEGTGNGGQAGAYYVDGAFSRNGYNGGTGTSTSFGDGGGGFGSAGGSGSTSVGVPGTGTLATIAGGNYMQGGWGGSSSVNTQASAKGCGGNAGAGAGTSTFTGKDGVDGYLLMYVY